jgi:hypothetical protein
MKLKRNNNSKKTKNSAVKDSIPNHDVFACASTLDEALLLRSVIALHCEWPLIYEHKNGSYEIGGLTKSGGKISDEVFFLIVEALEDHRKKHKTKKSSSKKDSKAEKEVHESKA